MFALILALGPTIPSRFCPPLAHQYQSWQTKSRPGSIKPIARAAYRETSSLSCWKWVTIEGLALFANLPAGGFRSPGRAVGTVGYLGKSDCGFPVVVPMTVL